MKIRQGFVSNSSSSSFVCDLCGRKEVGYDMGIADAEMAECVNGHTICLDEMVEAFDKEAISREDKITMMEEWYSYSKDEEPEYYKIKSGEFTEDEFEDMWENCWEQTESELVYEMPEKFCPICQMLEFANGDLAKYLQKKTGYTRDEAFAVVKEANRRRKKLYDNEYVMYALQRADIKMVDMVKEIRETYPTYFEFSKFIRS